jgi:hypothetical protein
MTSRGMEKMKHDTIGVDVSKDHLDAHRLADGAARRRRSWLRACRSGWRASSILEAAEHALDEIALAIGGFVERMMSLAGRIVRDDRNRAAFEKKATQTIAVVGCVGGQATPAGTPLINSVATRTSPIWPGVTSMAMGRPRASTMAWIFVLRPPRERPIACASAPLSTRRRAMSLGRRAIDGLTIAGIGARQRVKQPTPNAAHRPAAKPIVDRCRRPVDGRTILPPTAGLQNVDDAADDPPVVGPSRRELVLGQQRPIGSPLRFAQPEFARHDPRPSTRFGLNHR